MLTVAVAALVAGHEAPRPAVAQESSSAGRRSDPAAGSPWHATVPGPAAPIRIGLQAGHWRADEAPHELRRIRYNGTRWRETAEWEANLAIARLAGAELEALGYEVDILPAVVPPGYRAHLFIAIHADGSDSPQASGYRVAAPRRDATGRAPEIAQILREKYGEATGLRGLPVATRRMRNYYAFNYRRYRHALHPLTVGVIIETGFMTSARDRGVILGAPEKAAQGIVEAVKAFPATPPPAWQATGQPGEPGPRGEPGQPG